MILLHKGAKCAVDSAHLSLSDPVFLLVCQLKAIKPANCSAKDLSRKSVDNRAWFNPPGRGIILDDPDRCSLHRSSSKYSKSKNTLRDRDLDDKLYGVPHWSQILPRFLIYLKRQRKDHLWKEIVNLTAGRVHPSSYFGFEIPPAEDQRKGVIFVDPHPDKPRPPPPQREFVCIWDRKPMYHIHVLAMPRQRIVSPEELQNPAETVNALVEYVKTKIIPGFKRNPKFANYNFIYGFHTDPSQDQLHCHVFSCDHPISAPPSAFKKFTPNTVFFRDPPSLISLAESFATPPSHFTLYHDPTLKCTTIYEKN